MFTCILETVVANPPHIVNIIRGFITSDRFTVTFYDDVAFARFRNLKRRHLGAPRDSNCWLTNEKLDQEFWLILSSRV